MLSTHPLTEERCSRKEARSMHSFARHRPSRASEASAKETKGLIGSGGWRYDLGIWFIDTFVFRGQLRELRQRTANLAACNPENRCWMWAAARERWRWKSRAALAEQAASQALTRG